VNRNVIEIKSLPHSRIGCWVSAFDTPAILRYAPEQVNRQTNYELFSALILKSVYLKPYNALSFRNNNK